MDNFMDKLAKRFNAGEMIQANGEAEARENQRLKTQLEEYDKVMQEIRRLNLKTIEVSEQVSQMAACSIEQIESYDANVQIPDNGEMLDEIKESIGLIRDNLSAMEQRVLQSLAQQGSNDNQDEFISLSRKIDDSSTGIAQKMDASSSDMKKAIDDSVYRMEASVRQMETMLESLEASVSRVELGNDTSQRALEGSMRNLEQVITDKLEQKSGEEESAKQIKEMIVNVRLYLDEVQKHIEDYVHREDVKVYRNVQAAMNEQLSIKSRDLNDHMDHIEKEVQKNKGVKVLALLAVLFSGASLALQILQMLGIL